MKKGKKRKKRKNRKKRFGGDSSVFENGKPQSEESMRHNIATRLSND